MPTLIPPRRRVLRNHLSVGVAHSIAGLAPVAFFYWLQYPPFPQHWILFAGGFVGIALLAAAVDGLRRPLAITWDDGGLAYRSAEATDEVRWSDFRGYRLTWDTPRRLKIRRQGMSAVTVDIAAFDDQQRTALLLTLDTHWPRGWPLT